MTILFDSACVVNPHPFANGLVRTPPVLQPRLARHTATDEAWWAQESNRLARDYDVVSRSVRPVVHPANQVRPRCPSERLTDLNAEYVDKRAWSLGHDA